MLSNPYLVDDRVVQGDIRKILPVEDLGHDERFLVVVARDESQSQVCCSLTNVVVPI